MRKRKNITLAIDRETYRDVRIWCAERNTCISHVVQAFLQDLPGRAKMNDLFSLKPAKNDTSFALELMARMSQPKEKKAPAR